MPTGRYAEGAHIRPLGYPHDGPDVLGNVLCLCPNDHVRFDYGAIWLDDRLYVVDAQLGKAGHRITSSTSSTFATTGVCGRAS